MYVMIIYNIYLFIYLSKFHNIIIHYITGQIHIGFDQENTKQITSTPSPTPPHPTHIIMKHTYIQVLTNYVFL